MATCYHITGIVGQKMAPCNHTAVLAGQHTSCCSADYLCLSNGMCRNQNLSDVTNYYWRTGCTDKTFKDSACGRYCTQVPSSETDWYQLIWKCPEKEKYCCNTGDEPKYEDRVGRTNTSCCANTDLVFNALDPVVVATAQYIGSSFSVATSLGTASPTSSKSTPSGPSTSLIESATSPTWQAAEGEKRKNLAIPVGIGVGIGAFAVILFTLAYMGFRRRVRRRQELKTPIAPVEIMDRDPSELVGREKPAELLSPVPQGRGGG